MLTPPMTKITIIDSSIDSIVVVHFLFFPLIFCFLDKLDRCFALLKLDTSSELVYSSGLFHTCLIVEVHCRLCSEWSAYWSLFQYPLLFAVNESLIAIFQLDQISLPGNLTHSPKDLLYLSLPQTIVSFFFFSLQTFFRYYLISYPLTLSMPLLLLSFLPLFHTFFELISDTPQHFSSNSPVDTINQSRAIFHAEFKFPPLKWSILALLPLWWMRCFSISHVEVFISDLLQWGRRLAHLLDYLVFLIVFAVLSPYVSSTREISLNDCISGCLEDERNSALEAQIDLRYGGDNRAFSRCNIDPSVRNDGTRAHFCWLIKTGFTNQIAA